MVTHSLGASSARLSSPYLFSISWIKRRARRLAHAFQVNRREALLCARDDWSHFHPAANVAARLQGCNHG